MEESGMPSRSGNLTRAGKPKSETTHTTFFFSSPISHSRHKQVKIDVNLIDIFFPSESGGISCLIFMPGLQRLWVSIHTSQKKNNKKKTTFLHCSLSLMRFLPLWWKSALLQQTEEASCGSLREQIFSSSLRRKHLHRLSVNSSAPAIPIQPGLVPITQHAINQTRTTHHTDSSQWGVMVFYNKKENLYWEKAENVEYWAAPNELQQKKILYM